MRFTYSTTWHKSRVTARGSTAMEQLWVIPVRECRKWGINSNGGHISLPLQWFPEKKLFLYKKKEKKPPLPAVLISWIVNEYDKELLQHEFVPSLKKVLKRYIFVHCFTRRQQDAWKANIWHAAWIYCLWRRHAQTHTHTTPEVTASRDHQAYDIYIWNVEPRW